MSTEQERDEFRALVESLPGAEQERADFEVWYAKEYPTEPPPERHGEGYFHLWDKRLFSAYQAGRAALQMALTAEELEAIERVLLMAEYLPDLDSAEREALEAGWRILTHRR